MKQHLKPTMKNFYKKEIASLVNSKSPLIRQAALELGDNFTALDLGKKVKKLQEEYRVGPLPWTDLCSPRAHKERQAAVAEGRVEWMLTAWCYIRSCGGFENVPYATEEEAIEAGSKCGCNICGNLCRYDVRPVIKEKKQESKMITILNTSILASHGMYNYTPCTTEDARALAAEGFSSAVGHEATAQIISTVLGINCPMNRIQYKQEHGDKALIFKLRGRAPEGVILTMEEVEAIGYDFGLIERLR